jgi:hypothetical protein
MSRTRIALVATLALCLIAGGCGSGNRLLSIQALPLDPTILNNNTVYAAPFGTVQYQIQGWYSNRMVQTIPAASGKWSSSSTAIAAIDSNGLATSVGPLGVTTISVTVSGHTSTTVLSICDPTTGLCPP